MQKTTFIHLLGIFVIKMSTLCCSGETNEPCNASLLTSDKLSRESELIAAVDFHSLMIPLFPINYFPTDAPTVMNFL